MKLFLTLLTGLSLSASLPALADTSTPNDSVAAESNGPDAGWHGGHGGGHGGWHGGHGGWHHRHHCGPFGQFWCDVNPDTQEAELAQ